MPNLPQIILDQDPYDPAQWRLGYAPPPEQWVFDDNKGTREELTTTLIDAVVAWQSDNAYVIFDHDAKLRLRAAVRYVLLEWSALRGLRFAA